MLLATRCPFCETVFRLQSAQLAQRRGLVRCGHCDEVFDASSSLFDISEGGDFANAKPVAAAAAIEAFSGVRADGSVLTTGETSHPQTAASAAPSSADQTHTHDTSNAPASASASAADTASHAAEPVLADAPLEPFAYQTDAEASAEEAPQVWHKTARTAPASEPTVNPASPLHGIPDNEPHFGPASAGAAGVAAAGLGAAAAGAASAAAFGSTATASSYTAASTAGPGAAQTAAGGAGAGGPPGFGGGPAAGAASGEPFSVNPVNDGSDPFRVTREQRPVEGRRVGWAIAASVVGLVLVFGLLAQLAWWQREAVQVYFPRSQVLYLKACAELGCHVTPPHDIDGLQVEPSDLRQVDGPHKLELKMPLHNRFNIALAYPAIELTLLDDQNNVAVRRVLWPQDYVPPGTPIAAGLPAHTTQTMIVHLDTGMAVASNFRVQIFYP